MKYALLFFAIFLLCIRAKAQFPIENYFFIIKPYDKIRSENVWRLASQDTSLFLVLEKNNKIVTDIIPIKKDTLPIKIGLGIDSSPSKYIYKHLIKLKNTEHKYKTIYICPNVGWLYGKKSAKASDETHLKQLAKKLDAEYVDAKKLFTLYSCQTLEDFIIRFLLCKTPKKSRRKVNNTAKTLVKKNCH